MIISIVGSGGKTTLVKKLATDYRAEGKKVFVTTTTHMYIEEDTLLTDDADTIISALREKGFAMAGIPQGEKIKALSRETFDAVCKHVDVVLVEADGSKHMPLKFPNATAPVIPNNTDEILVVCGLTALGQQAQGDGRLPQAPPGYLSPSTGGCEDPARWLSLPKSGGGLAGTGAGCVDSPARVVLPPAQALHLRRRPCSQRGGGHGKSLGLCCDGDG